MAGEGTARGGARGGRGRGARGRGRGGRGSRGGRGGSAAAAEASSSSDNPAPPAADVQMNDAPAAQSSSETTVADTTPAPPPSTTAAPPPTRPAPARGAAAGGRFLPRAIRRSQVDRENIAAQESAKQDTKAAVDARLQRAARGGRGGRRARGAPPANFDRIIRGGAGGFGANIQASGSRGTPSSFRLYDAPSAGGGGSSGGASPSLGGVKKENGPLGFSTESSRPTGRRMNTDKIAEIITIDDDEMLVKSKEGTPIMLPKGMFREEPKEPDQPEIATTEEVEAAERGEPLLVSSGDASENGDEFYNEDDVEMKDDGSKWPGAKDIRRVKIEGEEFTEIDKFTRRRAEKKLEAKDIKRKMKFKDEEDRLEAEKMARQRKLFGVQSDDDSDDELKESKAERKPQIQEGGIYLFQFPPVMPPLYKVEKKATVGKNHVKDEPNDDVVMLNVPAHKSDKAVDLTADDEVKDEDEDGAGPTSSKKKEREPEEEPSGFVGKLVIRKSGKMQIIWGGMPFDCEMGVSINHYREAVLTEDDDEKKPDGFHGTAYGMGSILGKFNAVPHFSDVEDWVVDDSQLPPWGVGAAPEGTEMEE